MISYDLRAVTRAKQEAHIRSLIVQSALGEKLVLHGVHSEHLEGGELVEVRAELTTTPRQDALMEQAVSRLSLEPSVSSVTWAVRDPRMDEEDDEDGASLPRSRLRGRGRAPWWRRRRARQP
jgi:putative Mg2+ transporter-C (MgtC) family protein